MKPTIRRARTEAGHLAPGWIVTRQGYGFGSTEVTRHTTWDAALSGASATHLLASATQLLEREPFLLPPFVRTPRQVAHVDMA